MLVWELSDLGVHYSFPACIKRGEEVLEDWGLVKIVRALTDAYHKLVLRPDPSS
jgi:hypothetical protein